MIDKGEIRLSGELKSLMRQMGGNGVIIDAGGELPESLAAELKDRPELGFQAREGGSLLFSPQPGTEVSDIIGCLVARGLKVEGARRKEASLEELYSSILEKSEAAK